MSDDNKPVFFGNITEKEMKGNDGPWTLRKMSFKIEDAEKHANEKGYINLNLKTNRDGKMYAVVDTWKPKDNDGGERGGSRNNGGREKKDHGRGGRDLHIDEDED